MRVLSLLVVVVFSGLVACTSQSARRTTDMNHIKSINKEAQFRNMDVIWINPPPVKRESTINMTIKADPDTDETVDSGEESE